MTTPNTTPFNGEPVQAHVGVMRCALTGAIVFAVLFALCWLVGALSPFGASHMYMATFTMGAATPIVALVASLVCSAAMGFLIGALAALTYNALGFLARR
jgi:hypothetical protein